jgi:hypothetical protein
MVQLCCAVESLLVRTKLFRKLCENTCSCRGKIAGRSGAIGLLRIRLLDTDDRDETRGDRHEREG